MDRVTTRVRGAPGGPKGRQRQLMHAATLQATVSVHARAREYNDVPVAGRGRPVKDGGSIGSELSRHVRHRACARRAREGRPKGFLS